MTCLTSIRGRRAFNQPLLTMPVGFLDPFTASDFRFPFFCGKSSGKLRVYYFLLRRANRKSLRVSPEAFVFVLGQIGFTSLLPLASVTPTRSSIRLSHQHVITESADWLRCSLALGVLLTVHKHRMEASRIDLAERQQRFLLRGTKPVVRRRGPRWLRYWWLCRRYDRRRAIRARQAD